MPTQLFHHLLPFLQDPQVTQEKFQANEGSTIYTSSCTMLGVRFMATGFTTQDSANNLRSQLDAFLLNLYRGATNQSSDMLLADQSIFMPQTHRLKSKKLALERSFDAIDQKAASSEQPAQSRAPQSYVSLLHTYAMKNRLPTPKFDFFVERNLYGCSVEFSSILYTLDATFQKKAAVKEAICKHILRCLIDKEEQETKNQ